MNELEKRKERLNREFDETLDHLRREKIWLNCGVTEVDEKWKEFDRKVERFKEVVRLRDEKWKEFDRRVERFKEVVRLRDQFERTDYIRKGQAAIDRANKLG
jgi:hypothetical protein